MIKPSEKSMMKAIAICFKPYLKPEEAMIYCDLEKTQLAKKCDEYGIYKNESGYYKKQELDLMLSGGPTLIQQKVRAMRKHYK